MTDRVFDGKIKEGFTEYELEEYETDSGTLFKVVKRKRKHVHGQGYKTIGRPREVTQLLLEEEARAVKDLLKDRFDE